MLDVPCGAERIFLRANRKTKAKDVITHISVFFSFNIQMSAKIS